jgi:aminopeptidase N
MRRFYGESRYLKVGTDDFRRVMEEESGRSLERFFERWIYGSALPRIAFSYHIEPGADGRQEVVLRFDQQGDLFDLPVTVMLQYADRRSVDVTVPITERTVERRVPLDGSLRTVTVRDDDAALVAVNAL